MANLLPVLPAVIHSRYMYYAYNNRKTLSSSKSFNSLVRTGVEIRVGPLARGQWIRRRASWVHT